MNRTAINISFWGLLAIYTISRFLQVFPGRVPMLVIVALHVLPPLAFALIHGALFYRWRGILIFLLTCALVGNIFENLGVRTGFPFGHYYFTDLMGPKIFVVPMFLGLAYLGMAYLSWTLARIIMEGTHEILSGFRVIALPLVASCIMVSWDFSMDPIWSTILHAWIWRDGGTYFGVPLTNFFGWFLTVYIFYQLFAFYLSGRSTYIESLPPNYWKMSVLFYGISAIGNILLIIPRPGVPVVSDPSGALWKISDITAASVLVTIFTMGAFTLLAWIRLANPTLDTPLMHREIIS